MNKQRMRLQYIYGCLAGVFISKIITFYVPTSKDAALVYFWAVGLVVAVVLAAVNVAKSDG